MAVWAGPFCNIANALAVNVLAGMGFSGVIVSPELSREDYQNLAGQSVLPVGIVVSGSWPLCISRILNEEIRPGMTVTSPKQEDAWVAKYDSAYWLFPNWRLDLLAHKRKLQEYGFSLFVHLEEPVPRDIRLKKRQGVWNWQVGLR
jgi:putative protease